VVLETSHRFPAYGITQRITATTVLRLVADGRVGLDDPANDHLRTVRLADDTVTVRELLTHTGGVDHPAEPLADSVPELITLVGPVMACSGARGVVLYSNEGYAALGQLVADVTGSPYTAAAGGYRSNLSTGVSSVRAAVPEEPPHEPARSAQTMIQRGHPGLFCEWMVFAACLARKAAACC
jgi:hypothetical protein